MPTSDSIENFRRTTHSGKNALGFDMAEDTRVRAAGDGVVVETEDGSKFSVTLNAIQEREKVCIGFLVGSMPHVTNY